MIRHLSLSLFATTISVLFAKVASAAPCESLASLKLSQTTITASEIVRPGEFLPPGDPPADAARVVYQSLPEFCRVQGIIQPSSDSHIEFEVWLPVSGWNKKYLGTGNGGFAGAIGYTKIGSLTPSLSTALLAGYAASATDTGHNAANTDASWAIGHPEKVIDFGYRAIHETAVAAKAIIATYYGVEPKKSYFNSCSNGGRQALMEAQRFPSDYDGIIAGDPANFATHLSVAEIWNLQALALDPASYIPASKLPAIEAAVLSVCDAKDGVKDGVIDNPSKCKFDPKMLLCRAAESANCLTQPQITALRKIYEGPRNSRGQQIFPGLFPGAETGSRGWSYWVVGAESLQNASDYTYGVGALANMQYQDPNWDFRGYNVDRDVPITDNKTATVRNATNPDLKSFYDRGGKLILYHGWNDPAIAPQNTIQYYNNVVSKMGKKSATAFVRLYMVPGMQHCGDGPGPTDFGTVVGGLDPAHSIASALELWVEDGIAPARIITTKYKTADDPASGILRTRTLCPYPQKAQWKGSGSTDDSANFECRMP
jgi:feruloyl esterase